MIKFSEYKLELLKKISSLKILEIQKNEIRNYIHKTLSSENYKSLVDDKNPTDYLNHVLKAYGKNNYNLYIILNAIMNFLIFNLVYIGMLIYKNSGFNNIKLNSFIELTIFILTIIIFPLLKYFVRIGLIKNWNGFQIIKRIAIIIFSFFVINLAIYKFDFLNEINFSINSKIFGAISIILIIIIQIVLRLYKYDFIKK